jgi:hypothetical protein
MRLRGSFRFFFLAVPIMEPLPVVHCAHATFGDLCADAAAEPWCSAPALLLRETVTGGVPAQGTSLRLLHDETALRVLFDCTDNDPWATLATRKAPLYNEEVVEVFLDPEGDLLAYFEIEVNPLNAVLDLVVRRTRTGLRKEFRWECEGLRTRVHRHPRGWVAELAIPFGAIVAMPPRAGTRWRANFCRIDRPRGREWELSAWSPTGRPRFHTPERFGILQFD